MWKSAVKVLGALCFVLMLGAVPGVHAQLPDPRQMSGVPLPDPQLPVGTLTVRVVRGTLSNNLSNHNVEVTAGGSRREGVTDASGRAEFAGLRPGEQVRAATVVDGARIESQMITMPAQGGVRLMLVASDSGMAEREAENARLRNAPAQPGTVIFGGQSRFIIERGDEALNVFYVLDIVNTARTPVATPAPLIFDLPSGARSVTLLEGSTAEATVSGSRVTVTSPFAPGTTPLQIAYELPYRGARVTIEQKLPAALPDLAVAGETSDGVTMSSPLLRATRDMTSGGKSFTVGNGPGLPAGGVLTLTFENLPHHARWPRFAALGVALAVMLGGLVVAFSRPRPAVAAREEALADARNSRFQALEALEARRRAGAVTAEDYAAERTRLVSELEDIYVRLDGPSH